MLYRDSPPHPSRARRVEARSAGLPAGFRIVSGGQTGVDRAALDAALAAGIPCGGWCPRGRRAEDGRIAPRYPLRETASGDYRSRTVLNVEDSELTLIVARGMLRGGTALTCRLADERGKPHLTVDLCGDPDPAEVARRLSGAGARVINVAGPRESQQPGIYDAAYAFLSRVYRDLQADSVGS